MKRYHLKKMSDLLETLEIVSNNAKNKGHRSGFRCNQLAKEIADQFAVFVPTLTSIKIKDIHDLKLTKKSFNTIKQYVFILKKKGFVQSIKVIGKHYKYYKVNELSFTTMDINLVNKLSS